MFAELERKQKGLKNAQKKLQQEKTLKRKMADDLKACVYNSEILEKKLKKEKDYS